MVMRSKEFVGRAEGIKSHEFSIKSLIENIQGTLSRLNRKKDSLESSLSSLYAELAAAENDYDDEDGLDYGLIASIENQIGQTTDEIEAIEEDISQSSGELEKAEQEFEKVEEEKQQTLFEIQQRARTYSQDMSKIGGAYGAYASIGQSISQTMQSNYDALAQAASILEGSIEGLGSGNSIDGINLGGSSGTGNLRVNGLSIAISGANNIRPTNNSSGFLKSSQGSVIHSSNNGLKAASGGAIGIMSPSFNSSQTAFTGSSFLGFSCSGLQRDSVNARSLTSNQTAHDNGISRDSVPSDRVTQAYKRKPKHDVQIQGFSDQILDHTTMNTPRTIEEMRKQMTPEQQAYFDSAIAAGGGVQGQRAHLKGAGEEYYLTSSSEKRASGNFLTKDYPGNTPQERKENLQLPTGNDAVKVEKVRSSKPAVVFESNVSPQEEWAAKSGYVARKGMRQTFTPNHDKNGAIAAGLYFVTSDELTENQEQEDKLEGSAFLGTIGRWLGKPGTEPAHDVTPSDLPAETARDRHEQFVQQIKANVDPHKALHNVSANGSNDDVDIGQRELEITRDKFGERGIFTALGLSHRADSSIDAGDFDDSTPIKNQILRGSIPGDNRLRAMPRSLSSTKQRWRREIDGSLVYNTPHETAGRLDCRQGKVKNYLGTCGLVSCVNILRLAGVSASEAEIVAYAASTVDEASNAFLSSLSKRTLCVSNSFPAYNGQTGAKARQKILEHFGIPSYTAKQTISTIAEAVESGHGVIVSVYADTLYEGIRTNNGLHAVTITSVKKSATGRIIGFYVADSNAEYQREKAEERGGVGSEFYSVQELESALSERECNITSTIIR